MLTRNLALVGVGEDAAHAFCSMLDVLQGRTRCQWQVVQDISQAGVIVTQFHAGQSEALSGLQVDNRPILAVIRQSDLRPPTPYVLTHPFRVMQVMTVLDEIAEHAAAREPATRAARRTLAVASNWAFANSWRELQEPVSASIWHQTTTDSGALIVISKTLHSYACAPEVIEQIRSGALVPGPVVAVDAYKLESRFVRRPLCELLWYNALHADNKLAPWLAPNANFSIRRWPDFGTLPHTRLTLQLAAALSAKATSRRELVSSLDVQASDIDPLLNAFSLCGFIASDQRVTKRAYSATRPASFLQSLIGAFRQKLGSLG